MVAVLPQEVALLMLDLIRASLAGDPYGVFREHLITLYTLKNYLQLKALVSLPLSGDQNPSHLMNRMFALLPDDYKQDFILRGLFFRRLSIYVRSHLLCKKVFNPRALALTKPSLQRPAGEPCVLPHPKVSCLREVSFSLHEASFSFQAFSDSSYEVQISHSVWTLLVSQETW